ncbi:STAS/SEC14 domain-containing protein [Motiliproteus sediminis]|uniref:STAS/SEC14 domain-containing protein n=1 Tax=Motiliproteus sediminis TaxID=1468178 RepID=UPI001AEFBB6F|nr:STAS/SEC14 domain-containing protein [Motiliproteus sediminis]
MLMKLEQSSPTALGFLASGRLTDNDYKNFLIPEVKRTLEEQQSIRLLFMMEGFRGWDIQAAWDDLIFGMEINRRVERIAIVGDRDWEKWMARLTRAFTYGEVRYFDLKEREQAWAWIKE